MIDPKLLEMLCCPESRQPLQPAGAELLKRVNAQIEAGRVRNRAGQPVTRPCDEGLVRQDGLYLYPVCREIPVLLINESIPLQDGSPTSAAGL
jgi:uncharacterized protein